MDVSSEILHCFSSLMYRVCSLHFILAISYGECRFASWSSSCPFLFLFCLRETLVQVWSISLAERQQWNRDLANFYQRLPRSSNSPKPRCILEYGSKMPANNAKTHHHPLSLLHPNHHLNQHRHCYRHPRLNVVT